MSGFTLDMGQFGEYKAASENGSPMLFPYDGAVSLKLRKFECKKDKTGKEGIMLIFDSNEEGTPGTIFKFVSLEGTFPARKPGEEPTPRARVYVDMIVSSGLMTAADVTAAASAKKGFNVEQLTNQLLSKGGIVYGTVEAETDDQGKQRSDLKSFIRGGKGAYEAAKGQRTAHGARSKATNGSTISTSNSAQTASAAQLLDLGA